MVSSEDATRGIEPMRPRTVISGAGVFCEDCVCVSVAIESDDEEDEVVVEKKDVESADKRRLWRAHAI